MALGAGDGLWFAVELQGAEVLEARTELGLRDDELLDVLFGWVGAAGSAAGLAHVEVPLRLTELALTRKKTPPS